MKKMLPIPENTNNMPQTVLSSEEKTLKEIITQTDNRIRQGLEKETASTGTPMDELYGGAKFMAQLSNIGDGSVETGGGGIKKGFNTIAQNIAAKSQINAIQSNSESKTKKIK